MLLLRFGGGTALILGQREKVIKMKFRLELSRIQRPLEQRWSNGVKQDLERSVEIVGPLGHAAPPGSARRHRRTSIWFASGSPRSARCNQRKSIPPTGHADPLTSTAMAPIGDHWHPGNPPRERRSLSGVPGTARQRHRALARTRLPSNTARYLAQHDHLPGRDETAGIRQPF